MSKTLKHSWALLLLIPRSRAWAVLVLGVPVQSQYIYLSTTDPLETPLGCAPWKEPVGSCSCWVGRGSQTTDQQGKTQKKLRNPAQVGLLSLSTKHWSRALSLPTQVLRAPAHGAAETQENLSADAGMSFLPFSSQRILKNNTSKRLRAQKSRTERGATRAFFIKLHIFNPIS